MESAPSWISSTQGLIAGVTALIVAVPPLIAAIRGLIPTHVDSPDSSPKRRVWPWVAGIVGLCLFAASLLIFGVRYNIKQNLPLNADMAAAAWSVYANNDFNRAIERATDCISTFGPQARMEQAKLAAEGEPLPPTGVVSEPEKSKILSRGVLNDVGACLFVKAQAAAKLGRTDETRVAYQQLVGLTYARIYDPNGFFWSPSDAAAARLKESER